MIKRIRKETLVIILMVCIVYFGGYIFLRSRHIYPEGRNYDSGEKVMYGGVEYSFKGYLYSPEELLEAFDEELEGYEIYLDENKRYILVDEEYERTEKPSGKEKASYLFTPISKYWKTGVELELEDLIQKDGSIMPEELEVGQKSSRYQLFSIAKCNHADSVWEKFKDTTVYMELQEYEGSEYFRMVRIVN